MKVIKFQSKPNKPKKLEYTLQPNGMYKSNGTKGLEYPLLAFNHENPVLEAEHNGVNWKIGDEADFGVITEINLTDIGDIILRSNDDAEYINEAVKVEKKSKKAKKVKKEIPEELKLENIKKYLFDNVDFSDVYDESDFTQCCGITETGNFYNDVDLEEKINEELDNYCEENKNENGVKLELSKSIENACLTKAFQTELVKEDLKNYLKFTSNFIITLNIAEQSITYAAFKALRKEYSTLSFKEFYNPNTKNQLVLITNLITK